MEIRQLTQADFYDLRELLTTVFTVHNGKPSQFELMFPRLFGRENGFAPESHLGAFADGRLVGTAAMYPIDYVVGGVHIRLIGNGNVAVHRDYRGRGIMTRLLAEINNACDTKGDVCYLHGDPVRYGRFGYVSGGIQYLLTFRPGESGGLSLRPMTAADVPAMNALSRQKTDYVLRRDEDFLPALRSCGREALVIAENQGAAIGYLSLDKAAGHIEEYALAAPVENRVLPQVAGVLGRTTTVLISGYDPQAANRCRAVADVTVQEPALFRILQPEKLRQAAAALDLEETTLYAPYLT